MVCREVQLGVGHWLGFQLDFQSGMVAVPEDKIELLKVVSSEFYFHKAITVHIELYLFYRFIHFLLYIGQY